ncbi:MAG TPA: hypothetical protein DEA08_22485 [Planctomycetes bacterium]|nr:hypothetical protein [Planctomycetota bacterium]
MLDCFDLGDPGGEPLYSFHERLLTPLGGALARLEAQCGVALDPYGRTRLYPSQIELLLGFMNQAEASDELAGLLEFLAARVAAGAGVRIEGE